MLSTRSLNRALLARQCLLTREPLTPRRLVEKLVGLQAQSPQNPYVALWSRLERFAPDALSRAIAKKALVRIALMRSTIHLVTDHDCLTLRPVVQPAIDRSLRGTFGRRLAGLDLEALAAAGRRLVDEEPQLLASIGTALAKTWRGRDPFALSNAVRASVALVQPPPRGLWRTGGLALHTSAEHWLGRPLAHGTTPDRMLLRYLAAFGPATVADAQTWSGLSGLAAVFERLRPKLRTFRDERGRELFDIVNGPLPDPDTPAPPRFLPEYDNVLLSHHDRTRIVTPDVRKGLLTPGLLREARPTARARSVSWLLIDGFLAGMWNVEIAKGGATLFVRTAGALPKPQKPLVKDEGERLLAFLAPDATRYRVNLEEA